MTVAKKAGIVFFIIAGKSSSITTNAAHAKTKHKAVINFIGSDFGIRLLKMEISNIHPAIFSRLKITTIVTEIRTVVRNPLLIEDKCWFVSGLDFEELPDI